MDDDEKRRWFVNGLYWALCDEDGGYIPLTEAELQQLCEEVKRMRGTNPQTD